MVPARWGAIDTLQLSLVFVFHCDTLGYMNKVSLSQLLQMTADGQIRSLLAFQDLDSICELRDTLAREIKAAWQDGPDFCNLHLAGHFDLLTNIDRRLSQLAKAGAV